MNEILENIHQLMYLRAIPTDKQLHFAWTFFIATVSVHLFGDNYFLIVNGCLVVIMALKEVLDGASNSRIEHIKDLAAGLLGLIVADVLWFSICA